MDKSHKPLNQHLINLPAGTTHIKVGDVPDLLASAFYPLPDSYGRISSRESNKRGVEKAVKAGTITPLIPDSLEDHPFPFGDALDNSVITIEDFALLAKKIGVTLLIDVPAKVGDGETASKSDGGKRPLQRQKFQGGEILRVIAELGHGSLAMPKNKAGKLGVKADVKAKLKDGMWTERVFNKAWQRLRYSEDIKDA